MSQTSQKPLSSAPATGVRTRHRWILCAAPLIAGATVWAYASHRNPGETPQKPGATLVAERTVPPTTLPAVTLDVLRGRWQRLDGDYVLQLKGATPDGRLDASYFNPRSIHVADARAASVSGELRVHVELRDTGYAGNRYSLRYDAANDALVGTYVQPVAGRTFKIAFTRAAPEGPPRASGNARGRAGGDPEGPPRH